MSCMSHAYLVNIWMQLLLSRETVYTPKSGKLLLVLNVPQNIFCVLFF